MAMATCNVKLDLKEGQEPVTGTSTVPALSVVSGITGFGLIGVGVGVLIRSALKQGMSAGYAATLDAAIKLADAKPKTE